MLESLVNLYGADAPIDTSDGRQVDQIRGIPIATLRLARPMSSNWRNGGIETMRADADAATGSAAGRL